MILNCITIDDEPLALGLINSFVKITPFLELTASFSSAQEAIRCIEPKKIHLAFLDIEMPNLSGIDVAKMFQKVSVEYRPKVIFTTAYNQFAAESYRVEAVDYLLKPFEYDDFLIASRKALAYHQQISGNPIGVPPESSNPLHNECLFVRVGYQLVKIAWADILYIQGLKDYAKIFVDGSDTPIVTLGTLKSLMGKLPDERFMRVQRSYIVALNKVRAVTKNSLWIGEIEINIGEQYKDTLKMLMNNWL